MPSKNIVKLYVEDGFYHIYNRGVDKRTIYQKEKDYKVFLNELKAALAPPPDPSSLKKSFTLKGSTFKGVPKLPQNFHDEVELQSFCLMPNHFHFLLKQKAKDAMTRFMRSISTRYSMYFNNEYSRTGSLFQSSYKALLIETNEQLLHVSRYIHRNPKEFWTKPLSEYPYSSYGEYLGFRHTTWIHPEEILSFFKNRRKTLSKDILPYQSFVEYDEEGEKLLDGLTLDD